MSSPIGLESIQVKLETTNYQGKLNAVEQALNAGIGILQTGNRDGTFQVKQLNIQSHAELVIESTLTKTSNVNGKAVPRIQIKHYKEQIQRIVEKYLDFAKLIPQLNEEQLRRIEELNLNLQGTSSEILRNVNSMLTGRISQITKVNEDLNGEVAKLGSQITKNESDITSLREHLASAQQTFSSLQEEFSVQQRELVATQEINKALNNSYNTANIALAQVIATNLQLVSQIELKEKNIAELELKISKNEEMIRTLDSSNNEHNQKIKELKEINESFSAQLKISFTTEAELREALRINTELLTNAQGEVASLKEKLRGAALESSLLESTISMLNTQTRTKEAEEASKHKEEISKHESNIQGFQEKIEVLQKTNQELEAQLNKLQALQGTPDEKQRVITDLQKKVADLAAKNKSLESQNKSLHDTQENKERLLDQSRQEKETLSDNVTTLKEKIAKLEIELQNFKKMKGRLEIRSKREETNKALVDTQAKLKAAEELLASDSRKLEQTKKELEDKDHTVQNLSNELKASRAVLAKTNESLEAALKDLQEKTHLLEETTGTMNTLTQQLSDLTNSSVEKDTNLEAALLDLEQQLANKKAESEILISTCDSLKNSISLMEKDLAEKDQFKEFLTDELINQDETIDSLLHPPASVTVQPAARSTWKVVTFVGSVFGNVAAAANYFAPVATRALVDRVTSFSPQDALNLVNSFTTEAMIDVYNNRDLDYSDGYGVTPTNIFTIAVAGVVGFGLNWYLARRKPASEETAKPA